jgi:hypothetical protein
MKKITAHFFWHGNLSLYEYGCISSFVKNNFNVNVWSYDQLKLPNGATHMDASKVLSKDLLFNFEMPKGNVGSIAAFSDLFRLEVIKNFGGWWFDTDCICLRSEEEFRVINNYNNLVAGWENDKIINNAVISMTPALAKTCIDKVNILSKENKNRFKWGETGPSLITSTVKENNLFDEILPSSAFYPINWRNALDALDPNKTDTIETESKNAYVYHYWSEIFSRNKINKLILPQYGSFLYKHFNEFYEDFKK